jgi:uncharacterized protein (DUF1330 family)
MAGYLIANIEVRDREAFEAYRRQVAPVIAAFGGRYLVRGGAVTPVEGDLGLRRLVILEFPSLEAVRRFYDSPEYAPLLRLRAESTVSHVALVEGYEPPPPG